MNKSLFLILLIFINTSLCQAKTDTNDWYVGIGIMGNGINNEEDGNVPHDLPGNKYGLFVGYSLSQRVSSELGYFQHETATQYFSGQSGESVKWSKSFDYKYVGIKYDLFQGKKLTGSLKLSALFAKYSSNIDSKSFNSLSPSFHLNWHISDDFDLAFDTEYSEYYTGFNNKRYLSFFGLSIIKTF